MIFTAQSLTIPGHPFDNPVDIRLIMSVQLVDNVSYFQLQSPAMIDDMTMSSIGLTMTISL